VIPIFMSKIFKNQTVVISGGLGDIGFATAKLFAAQGANIALSDLHPDHIAIPYLAELKKHDVNCLYTQTDVTDVDAIHNWINEAEKTLGTITITIANAATVTLKRIHEITPAQWSKELRVNLDSAFFLTQYTTAKLVAKKMPGRVVFVGSWAGTKVHAHIPAYSVAKAGLSMLCKCMALELAEHNILVNEIAPGFVSAGLTGKIWKDNPGREELAKAKVPTKKVITADEVASQILFLCNPTNQHMTGSTLLMDGGLSLQ
jgi:glucose 1-dehydrogenase